MTTQYFLPFYGSFTMHDFGKVEWLPNPNLERNTEDQFKINLQNGHFDDKVLTGNYTIETMI